MSTRFDASHLLDFTRRVFLHFDVPPVDALQAADVLLAADLRGIDSHGIARLRRYVDLLLEGAVNPRPDVHVVRETPSTATVDGDNGLGLVVGPWANALAQRKAEAVGSGWVSVSNSNHFGIAGYYVLQGLERDLIGFAMTNASKLVAPVWGGERMLGTNPLAVAFPGHAEPPIVIDLATSAVSYGKIQIAGREGASIPEGWAVDADGAPTTDPAQMVNGGALLPLGSTRERGGHKGYALGIMVDLLCGALSGANWGPFAPPFALRQFTPAKQVGRGIGHFFGALRLDGFIDPADFRAQIDDYVRTFRATRPAPGTDGPLLPGDPERLAEADRRAHGIPLLPAVVADLRAVADVTGVDFD